MVDEVLRNGRERWRLAQSPRSADLPLLPCSGRLDQSAHEIEIEIGLDLGAAGRTGDWLNWRIVGRSNEIEVYPARQDCSAARLLCRYSLGETPVRLWKAEVKALRAE